MVGAGNRGHLAYGAFAERNPDKAKFVAVVEPDDGRRARFALAHVLRYAPFFTAIREILASDHLGAIVSVDWRENLIYWHFAHSYVRGNWGKKAEGGPMILTKCCHDLDLLVWMFGRCVQVSSSGSLTHFTRDAVGPEIPGRCTDGCPIAASCPYFAPRVYLDRLRENPASFAVAAVTLDRTPEGVM